jgi:hypothetical protein
MKNNSRKPPRKSLALKTINVGFWLLSVDRHRADSLSLNRQFCVSRGRQINPHLSTTDPVHVRFGFDNTIIGNVFSKEGLPFCSFRTG